MNAPHLDLDHALVRRLQRNAGELINAAAKQRRQEGRPPLSGEAERQAGRAHIQTAVNSYNAQLAESGQETLGWETDAALVDAIWAKIFGAGSLQHLLDDPAIENIDINGHERVFVTYADGRRERVPAIAATEEELLTQVQTLAAHAGLTARSFDTSNPQLDLRLPDGSRLSAVQQATPWPAYSIRRHRLGHEADLDFLVGTETMSQEVAEFLAHAVKARLNIMIAGSTNSGKTTLLRAMAKEIDPAERLLTVEKALELGLHEDDQAHPNVVPMELVEPNSEGFGGISMAELVRRSLRANPDRVIVGEVLGDEVVTMLNAMSQGNDGSLSTIHAESAGVALQRIGVYAKQAEEKLDLQTTAMLTATALDLIVFLKKDGARRSVREILEVTGFNGEQATTAELFVDDGTGTAIRRSEVQITERNLERLERAGWKPPEERW